MFNEKTKRDIEEIKKGFFCPKNYICIGFGVDSLCRIKKFNSGIMYECQENNPTSCTMAFPFGFNRYFCKCPLRIYLAKNSENNKTED